MCRANLALKSWLKILASLPPRALMRYAVRFSISIVLVLSVTVLGCEEQPGETFTGTVNSELPLTLPLSGKKACVARLTLSRGADTKSGGGSIDTLQHRWAPKATITVDGTPLKVSGNKGNPSYSEFGDEWHWNKSFPDKKPPEGLLGWGHDSTIKALASKSGHLGTRYVTLSEEFAPCGSQIRVRAFRKGDTLELVDTNKVDTTNALAAAGGAIAGFFCCAVFPMILLIGFVIRRSMKKKEGA